MIVVSEAAKVDTHGDAGVGDRFVHDFRLDFRHHGDGPAPPDGVVERQQQEVRPGGRLPELGAEAREVLEVCRPVLAEW